ncbi:hypothetical protein GOODEAATRI_031287 [Goodea atripinnis]|uniref:Uncharacterized protein n=1 Tax=Goodea atripinnis TaxID=208336 RepID=A0ABV0MYP3_9TELE
MFSHGGRCLAIAEGTIWEELITVSVVAQRFWFDSIDIQAGLIRRRLNIQVETLTSSVCSSRLCLFMDNITDVEMIGYQIILYMSDSVRLVEHRVYWGDRDSASSGLGLPMLGEVRRGSCCCCWRRCF